MIIKNSLDQFLLALMLNEHSSTECVRAMEAFGRLPEQQQNMQTLLQNFNSLTHYKSIVFQHTAYGRFPADGSALLSLFGITFVYNFFKSIVASVPAETSLDLTLLFKIFRDSYAEYAAAVSPNDLQEKMPELSLEEINSLLVVIRQFISEGFTNIPRGSRNATLN